MISASQKPAASKDRIFGQSPDPALNAPPRKLPRSQNELITPKRKPGSGLWTPERRAAASLRARRQKPWLHSTGPKTKDGKARSCLNSWKHGLNSRSGRALRATLRGYSTFLSGLNAQITAEKRRLRLLKTRMDAFNPCNPAVNPLITASIERPTSPVQRHYALALYPRGENHALLRDRVYRTARP